MNELKIINLKPENSLINNTLNKNLIKININDLDINNLSFDNNFSIDHTNFINLDKISLFIKIH